MNSTETLLLEKTSDIRAIVEVRIHSKPHRCRRKCKVKTVNNLNKLPGVLCHYSHQTHGFITNLILHRKIFSCKTTKRRGKWLHNFKDSRLWISFLDGYSTVCHSTMCSKAFWFVLCFSVAVGVKLGFKLGLQGAPDSILVKTQSSSGELTAKQCWHRWKDFIIEWSVELLALLS